MLEAISCQKIINLVNQRTDNRASSKLDMEAELMMAAQEFALERRWWWRRKTAAFTLTPGNPIYDMTANPVGFPDYQQIARRGVKVFQPFTAPASPVSYPNPTCSFNFLDAVFEVDRQDTITVLQANNQVPQGMPAEYFMVPGQTWLMNFNPPPDQAYPVIVAAWAVPMWQLGSMPTALPLVPEYFYPIVTKRLEMHAAAYILGEDSPKYASAAKEYETMLERSAIYTDFAEGKVTQVIDTAHEDSIRSTH